MLKPLWKQYKKVLPIEKMSLSNVYFEQLLPNINVSAYIQEVKKKGCSGPKTLLNGGELKIFMKILQTFLEKGTKSAKQLK